MTKLELAMESAKEAMSRYGTDMWDPEYLEETLERVLKELKEGKYLETYYETLNC